MSFETIGTSALVYLMSFTMNVHIRFMTCLMVDVMPGVPVRKQTDLSIAITYLACFCYLKAWCMRNRMLLIGRRMMCFVGERI